MISLRHRVLWASMLASATLASAGAFAQAPVAAPAAPAAQSQPGGAVAAPAQRMERGDPAKRFERMKEHRAKRMADLKAKLKLSPAQDSAWSNFTASTQPPSGPRPQRVDRAEFAKLTTPQRIERMQARQAERSARFAKRADATKTFYAALNADQQKTFDAETAHFGHGGHRGHGRHGHGHGGPEGQAAPAAPAKS
ncbi:MAG: hypothetical protein EOO26_15380 [Comamonadaceae bacterium]|nr:MAG: hypothetical protein EOO26_15380 [Comamonadaceae bacterium]